MRINKTQCYMMLREFLVTRPEFKTEPFYLTGIGEKGAIEFSPKEESGLLVKVRKQSQGECYVLNDKVIVKYMLKFSDNYNFYNNEDGTFTFYPGKKNK